MSSKPKQKPSESEEEVRYEECGETKNVIDVVRSFMGLSDNTSRKHLKVVHRDICGNEITVEIT